MTVISASTPSGRSPTTIESALPLSFRDRNFRPRFDIPAGMLMLTSSPIVHPLMLPCYSKRCPKSTAGSPSSHPSLAVAAPAAAIIVATAHAMHHSQFGRLMCVMTSSSAAIYAACSLCEMCVLQFSSTTPCHPSIAYYPYLFRCSTPHRDYPHENGGKVPRI